MDRIIGIFFIFIIGWDIQCLPISNGFTVKFNPISVKEDVRPKTFGAMFAKIPQESTPEATMRREMMSTAYLPLPSEVGPGCTNQIAKILFPLKNDINASINWDGPDLINLPIIKQPYREYKILVATAPPNVKIGGDDKPTVVYIVFPEDDTNNLNSINIPSIYFVHKSENIVNLEKKQENDPIFIVDSNRTVTGLRSKAIAKFVKFKNKLINRYGYDVSP